METERDWPDCRRRGRTVKTSQNKSTEIINKFLKIARRVEPWWGPSSLISYSLVSTNLKCLGILTAVSLFVWIISTIISTVTRPLFLYTQTIVTSKLLRTTYTSWKIINIHVIWSLPSSWILSIYDNFLTEGKWLCHT